MKENEERKAEIMLTSVYSAGSMGIDGFIVTVECDHQDKLGKFDIVGLPDAAIKEAKERVATACENSGFWSIFAMK